MEIILIFVYFLVLVVLITFIVGSVSAAPWLPTKKNQIRELVKIVPVKKGMIVYDLGCGDGSVIFALARFNPNVKMIGLEISLLPYFIALLNKFFYFKKYKNIKIKYKNLFFEDLSKADLVFIFLFNKCYGRLISKFKKELKDDCTVVVEAWPLPDIKEVKKIKKENLLSIFLYKGYQFKDKK